MQGDEDEQAVAAAWLAHRIMAGAAIGRSRRSRHVERVNLDP